MAKHDVPDDVSVHTFYKEYIPSFFSQPSNCGGLSPGNDNDIIIQYNIEGQCFCVRSKDGAIVDITESEVDTPIIHVDIDEEHWRDVVTGKYDGVLDIFTDPLMSIDNRKHKVFMSSKGTLKIELKKSNGDILPITLIFNGAEEPSAVMSLDIEDWASLHKKETCGTALFVGGRLRFTGDMFFLLRLQTLL